MRRSDGGHSARFPALALGLILVVAILTRFVGLELQSLRNDELASWAQSNYETFAEVVERGVGPDPHPPGFQFLVWLVEQHIGDSAAQLRAPSAVAGVFAVLVMFLLGRQLWGNREGLTAAALTALSSAAIYYSQDARAYSLLFLSSAGSSYFLWRLIENLHENGPVERGVVLGYILTSAAACYLHYFGLVLFAVQIAYLCGVSVVGRRWSRLIVGLVTLGAVALLYLPWWPGFIDDLTARKAPDWIVPPGKLFPVHLLNFFLNRSMLLVSAAFLLLTYMLLAELSRLWRQRRSVRLFDELRTPEFFTAYWFLMPFTVAVVRSYLSEPVATIRNLVIIIPALYLIIARALARLPAKRRLRDAATLGFLLVAAVQLMFGIRYYSTPQKHQFREAAQYVVTHESDRPDAPVYAFTFRMSYFNYYLERLGGSSRVSFVGGRIDDIEPMMAVLEQDRPTAFWYLTGNRVPDAAFLAAIGEAGFDVADQQLFYGTTVSYLVKRR